MKKIMIALIGVILIIISFVLDFYSLWRLVLVLIGILCIDINIAINNKNIFLILLTPLFLLVFSYLLDIFLVSYYQKFPIFSYEIKSSAKVSTYNSFLYRMINCNGTLNMDYGYQKEYICDKDDLDTIMVNAFLSEAIESFKTYHQKFIKLEGKVSKISGANILELSSYEEVDNALNAYVTFNTDYTIRINTNSDLTLLRIYDDVTVIGLVSKLNKGDNVVIDLIDAVVIPSDIYNNYTLEVIENNTDEVVNYVEKNNIYLLGINDIYVHFDEKHIYELKYLFADERITLDNFIKDKKYEEIKDEEEQVKGYLYELDKFKILKCSNEKVIFSKLNQKLNFKNCE